LKGALTRLTKNHDKAVGCRHDDRKLGLRGDAETYDDDAPTRIRGSGGCAREGERDKGE
jgi:hypothetical protein